MLKQIVLSGIIVEESSAFTLDELSRACGKPEKWVIGLVDEGIIEAEGGDPRHWQFHGYCLRRVQIIQRLEADLGLNLAGAALALELLDEVETLRNRIAILEQ
ncbi:chaperone modulator CbpM [Psychromonas antarctica]|jgi:chaperone modulatory protein CbpM|uniref:chaperone modulator CbpM n=1 Tax=Psychromonas antarctica TaxID=67573 RepID=UPI001EE7E3E9|nr:chaperone modulator CbpM [Psychromonas antarctica]MCG6199990.1 chaperone modulator CbpM [Psychromonas antarctica]